MLKIVPMKEAVGKGYKIRFLTGRTLMPRNLFDLLKKQCGIETAKQICKLISANTLVEISDSLPPPPPPPKYKSNRDGIQKKESSKDVITITFICYTILITVLFIYLLIS